MIVADKKYLEWSALLIISFIGMGISLWGYWQIVNLPPPTSLDIKKAPKILFIFSPSNNALIDNPVSISGKINDTSRSFRIRIKDSNNQILEDLQIDPSVSKLNLFNILLKYKNPTIEKGLIQFYEYLSEDDLEIGHRSIPVTFSN